MDNNEIQNDLKLIIQNQNQVIVEEQCCTALTIIMNAEGDMFSTFAGVYNTALLKKLKKNNNKYFNNLIKKLKTTKEDYVNNLPDVTNQQEQEQAKQPKTRTKQNMTKKDLETLIAQTPELTPEQTVEYEKKKAELEKIDNRKTAKPKTTTSSKSTTQKKTTTKSTTKK